MNTPEQIVAIRDAREARLDGFPRDPATAIDGMAGVHAGEPSIEIGGRLHFVLDVLAVAAAALQWEHFDASDAKHLRSLLSLAEDAARKQLDVDTEVSERLHAVRRLARK